MLAARHRGRDPARARRDLRAWPPAPRSTSAAARRSSRSTSRAACGPALPTPPSRRRCCRSCRAGASCSSCSSRSSSRTTGCASPRRTCARRRSCSRSRSTAASSPCRRSARRTSSASAACAVTVPSCAVRRSSPATRSCSPPNLTNLCAGPFGTPPHPAIFSQEDIYQVIEEGRGAMPSWSIRYQGALNDQQINDLVVYLVEMSSENVPFEDNVCLNEEASARALEENLRPTAARREPEGPVDGADELPRIRDRVRHPVEGRRRHDHGVHAVHLQHVRDAERDLRPVARLPRADGLALGLDDPAVRALALRLLVARASRRPRTSGRAAPSPHGSRSRRRSTRRRTGTRRTRRGRAIRGSEPESGQRRRAERERRCDGVPGRADERGARPRGDRPDRDPRQPVRDRLDPVRRGRRHEARGRAVALHRRRAAVDRLPVLRHRQRAPVLVHVPRRLDRRVRGCSCRCSTAPRRSARSS